MSYPKHVFAQLKALDSGSLIGTLEKDGWVLDTTVGSIRTYIKQAENRPNRRVQVHYHGDKRTYGRWLLNKMLSEIEWTENDLRRLKLIK